MIEHQHHLLPGERVVWSGRPQDGLILRKADGLLIPFSLLWCGFAIFWTFTAVGGGAPPFFMIFGMAFVAVGLYIVFGRFLHDLIIRRGLRYLVTNQRVLILKGGGATMAQSLDLDRLPSLELQEHGGGLGTIRFAPTISGVFGGGRGLDAWTPALDSTPRFQRIPEVRQVYEIIRRASRPAERGRG